MNPQHFERCLVMIAAKEGSTVELYGTGFLCHNEGYFITCAHNVPLTKILGLVQGASFNGFPPITLNSVTAHIARLAQLDSLHDVALLKSSVGSAVAPELDETPVSVGAPVAVLGFPFLAKNLHVPKVTYTHICGTSTDVDGAQYLHLDANLHEGNSGGPVIALDSGKIVGVAVGRFNPIGSLSGVSVGGVALGTDSTISFAVPIQPVMNMLRSQGLIHE